MKHPKYTNPGDLRLAQKHIRMALAAIVRLQQANGDIYVEGTDPKAPAAPFTNTVRSARGFLSLANRMIEAAQHQSRYSSTTLGHVNFQALNRAEAAFRREQE